MAALLLSTPPPVVSPDPLNSSNSSLAPPPPAALGAVRLGMALLLAAMALGVPGNLFVVWTVLCRLRRRSVTSLLLLHLACADAAVLLTAPFFLRYLAAGLDWEFGDATCRCLHYACCVNMYASVLLIGGMSLDRLLGVSRPFLSQKVRTKSRAGRVALGIWAAALVLSVPMLFYRRAGAAEGAAAGGGQGRRSCEPHHPGPGHLVFQYTLETAASFLLPFGAMAFSYCRISRQLAGAGGSGFQRRWRRRSRRRSGRLIALILASFALFWAPYHAVNVLQVAGVLAGAAGLAAAAHRARPLVTALAFLSSSVNPVLYAFAGSAFIRSAGLDFVARLLDGTSSDNASLKKSRNASRDPGGEEGGSVRLAAVCAGPAGEQGKGEEEGKGGKEGEKEGKDEGRE